ncbi:MAG: helix-turn-helix domain-containing protein [Bacillota bacterium]
MKLSLKERLKLLREEKGLTQEKLAKNLSLSVSAIGMYEAGERQPPYATLERIASFFDVSVDYLLGRTEERHGFIREPREDYVFLRYRTRPLLPEEDPDKARSLFPLEPLPVTGVVRGGRISLAVKDLEGYLNVPTAYGADFGLIIKGESLSGIGIHDGAIAICKYVYDDFIAPGTLVVAVTDDQATCKRLAYENGVWLLRAANPDFPDIPLNEGNHRIQAVVLDVYKFVYRNPLLSK